MLATPPSPPEQLALALSKARAARAARVDLVHRVEAGRATAADVLVSTDAAARTLRVVALLESVPGVGKVAARHLATELGLPGDRQVHELSSTQQHALLARLGR